MVLANNIGGRGRQLLLPYAIYGAFAFLAMVLEKMNFLWQQAVYFLWQQL